MRGYEKEQRSLTREQKEAVGLLSIGTFLEYFDLMLYVHMSVLLNKIFFSPDNTYSVKMPTAFAYCSTFVFSPFYSLLFGWIGDTIGRKPTIIITTMLMACTCIGMAILPSYDEIGFTATVLVTLFRAIQGISSTTEVTGAELYLTETVKPPLQYPAVTSFMVSTALGTMAALAVATLVTSTNLNWRYAFLFGAFVAITGTMARTTLKETPDFVDAKRRIKLAIEKTGLDPKQIENNDIVNEKTKLKTLLSYFLITCAYPVWNYFGYFYCGNILTEDFGYSPAEVINHNFYIAIGDLLSAILLAYLSYKIYPLKILRATFYILVIFLCFFPVIMQNLTPSYIMLINYIFLCLLLRLPLLKQFFINIFRYLNVLCILASYMLCPVRSCS
ncbi:sugar (and other) transporter family protein [Rickettsia hoogstraalii str. RCCE3]|nr:sugar (and other) transporter family protein [Rickettsia hoogstraalii str. RCCE3]